LYRTDVAMQRLYSKPEFDIRNRHSGMDCQNLGHMDVLKHHL